MPMNNENMKKYMANRRLQRRLKLIEMAGGKCIKCRSTKDLEFDHREGKDRKFRLTGSGLDKAWDKILEEFKKCDLLCRKCHRNKTNTMKEYGGGHNKNNDPYVHGSMRMYQEKECRCKLCKKAKQLYRNKELKYTEVMPV